MGDKTQIDRIIELEDAVRLLKEKVCTLERKVAEIPTRHAPFTVKRSN